MLRATSLINRRVNIFLLSSFPLREKLFFLFLSFFTRPFETIDRKKLALRFDGRGGEGDDPRKSNRFATAKVLYAPRASINSHRGANGRKLVYINETIFHAVERKEEGKRKGREKESEGTGDYHPEAGNNDIRVQWDDGRFRCVRGGELRPTFVSTFLKNKARPKNRGGGWMDIHNESCRLEWRTRGTGQAVEIFLSAECLVFITRFSREKKKNPFPASLWTFVSRKRERERDEKKEFAFVFTFNRGTILDRGTPLYIYICIYIYTFPSLFVAVPWRKENYLGIGTFKTFRMFSYNFVNAVYG